MEAMGNSSCLRTAKKIVESQRGITLSIETCRPIRCSGGSSGRDPGREPLIGAFTAPTILAVEIVKIFKKKSRRRCNLVVVHQPR